jgi:hypothetical protein
LEEINIDDDPALSELYGDDIPVIFINGIKAFKSSSASSGGCRGAEPPHRLLASLQCLSQQHLPPAGSGPLGIPMTLSKRARRSLESETLSFIH